jgi:hypothetical protein
MDPVCIKLLVLTLFKFSSKRKHFGNKKYWKTFTFMENKAHLTMKANNLQGKRKEISAWTRLCTCVHTCICTYVCLSGESRTPFFSARITLYIVWKTNTSNFALFFKKKLSFFPKVKWKTSIYATLTRTKFQTAQLPKCLNRKMSNIYLYRHSHSM